MTYDDVATARGTSRDAAIRWTQRRKLRRQPGNDGRMRVLVPPDSIGGPRVPHTGADPVAAFEAALAAIREAHAGEVRGLRERLQQAEEAAERLRQAEAERKGQGRWQRIKMAWRG